MDKKSSARKIEIKDKEETETFKTPNNFLMEYEIERDRKKESTKLCKRKT